MFNIPISGAGLRIGFWNVNRLKSRKIPKLTDESFLSYILESDITGLSETHTEEVPQIPGCYSICKPRKKSKNDIKSGGLAIVVKNSIKKGVQIVNTSSADLLWVKLDKGFFRISVDIFVCVAYFSPDNSSFSKKLDYCPFDKLEVDIERFRHLGEVIIGGDLNARTATLPDFIVDSDNAYKYDHVPLPGFYDSDGDMCSQRLNHDKVVNTHGRKLVSLCQSHNLRIVNGRKIGDSTGYFTSFNWNGCSVVDYALVSPALLDAVSSFSVGDLTPFSDHCPIALTLLMSDFQTSEVISSQSGLDQNKTGDKLNPLPVKYIWDANSGDSFRKGLALPAIDKQIRDFLNEDIQNDQNGIDQATENINNIFTSAAEASLRKHLSFSKKKSTPRIVRKKRWFDRDCISLRQDVAKAGRSLRKSPFDARLRIHYFSILKMYKRLIKRKKKEYVRSLVTNIMDASHHNPKVFWNTLKFLRGDISQTQQPSQGADIQPEDWLKYFKKLNEIPEAEGTDPYINEINDELRNLESSTTFSDLDYRITHRELVTVLRNLKNNKAIGFDSISNEMLKHSNDKLTSAILKLFNFVLQSSNYPAVWARGIISPIYKSGDTSVCSNYRGINVSSCLGKLFSTILNQRLRNHALNRKLIPENQIGFMPDCRTSDHIFILKSAIDKYLRKKKKLYVCFVDFRKAFDSVRHEALFLKMQRLGIGGLFYKIVKEMYSNCYLSVKTQKGLTKSFRSSIGVRQGCALSPLLFNIFISDLHQSFKSGDPITLFSKKISHLLYADDLVILSESPTGLQSSLDSLHEYCTKWKLDVNIDKTKVVIFSKTTARKKSQMDYNFHIGDKYIEISEEYKYLGIIFSSNGSLLQAKMVLEKKAKRALYSMHSYLTDHSLPVDCSLALFNKLISPIASYGSEVWAPYCIPLNGVLKGNGSIFEKYNDFPGAKCQMKFCKRLLGVHEKAVNLAVLGELGQLPFIVNSLQQCINFWLHILASPSDSLLHNAYLNTYKDNYEGSDNKWMMLIRYTCKTFGLDQIWENHSVQKREIPAIMKSLKVRLKGEFISFWEKSISQMSERLNVFYNSKSKTGFVLEKYLITVNNMKHRQTLTKLRIGAHQLAAETGRYKKIPKANRVCISCDEGVVEDEFHFVMECKQFTDERVIFLDKVALQVPEFQLMSVKDKFNAIISNPDLGILTARYIFDTYPYKK